MRSSADMYMLSASLMMVAMVATVAAHINVTWVRPAWGWPYPLNGWSTYTRSCVAVAGIALLLGCVMFAVGLWVEKRAN